MADYLNIAGRVRTTASDGVAMEAQEVKDLNLNKSQQEVNADVQTELGDRYTKEETYSREEIEELVDPTNYVSVVATDQTTAVTDLLPAEGATDTIYRIGNWDGTQYDPTVYALYSWNGTAYVCLSVRSFVGEIYDISANHPDGQGNPAVYAGLAAALGTGGENIPADIRRGGMTVKFIQGDNVQSSDNKYVQYRCTADEFTTDVTKWAICDEGVYVENPEFIYVKTDEDDRILWAIRKNGDIFYGAGVPQQVIDYINEKIAELSLDEIVAFLNDLEKGDKTLQDLLDEKVDKEDGKSLIDAEYAESVSVVENPEWMEVKTDSDDKVLSSRGLNGGLKEHVSIETPILEVTNSLILNNVTIKGNANLEGKINGVASQEDMEALDERVGLLEDIEGTIPSIWQDSVNNCITNVQNNNLLSAKNGDSFVFVTDSHFPTNKGNGIKIAHVVSEKTNNKIFVHGGDFVTKNKTRNEFFSIMRDYTAQLKQFYKNDWRILYGNHDNNTQDPSNPSNNITNDEFYAVAMKGFESNVVNPERNLYYYWDNTNQGIRYICFNFGTGGHVDAQLSWFDTIVRSAPSNAHICIMIHGMWNNGQDVFMTETQHLADMCDAINTRDTYTLNGTTYDYSSTTAKVCCIICGHIHSLKQVYHGTSEIPVIALEADTYEGDVTIYSQKVHFIDLDFTNGKIYIFTIGYRIDDQQGRDKKEYNIVI